MPPADAAGDDALLIDAGTLDARPPGTIKNFDQCDPSSVDNPCTCSATEDCLDVTADCIKVPWVAQKRCLPPCTTGTGTDTVYDQSMCPFSSACYPSGGGGLGADFALMAGHCYFSYCGFDVPTGSGTFVNGQTRGDCLLGAELWSPDPDDLHPGTCISLGDGTFGVCRENGSVLPGGVCDLDQFIRTRDGANCDGDGLCIGMLGEAQGTCARQCDPRLILSGDPAGGTCTDGQNCYDDSIVLTSPTSGKARRGTIGECQDLKACALYDTAACPDDPGGGLDAKMGCVASNAVRPTGYCDTYGGGDLGVGDSCTAGATSDATECVSGAFCPGTSSATCERMCDMPADAPVCSPDAVPPVVCTGGLSCVKASPTDADGHCYHVDCGTGRACTALFVDAGFDNSVGTIDDDYTADWGACELSGS